MQIADRDVPDVLSLFGMSGFPEVRNTGDAFTRLRHQSGRSRDFRSIISSLTPVHVTSMTSTGGIRTSVDLRGPSARSNEHPLLAVAEQQARLGGVSSMGDNMNIRGFFDSLFPRGSTSSGSSRRRPFGPLLSDRRWGTDLGNLEYLDSRVDVLASTLEANLDDCIAPVQRSDTRSTRAASSRLSRWADPSIPATESSDTIGESKDEDVLQETKDMDDVPSLARRQPRMSGDQLFDLDQLFNAVTNQLTSALARRNPSFAPADSTHLPDNSNSTEVPSRDDDVPASSGVDDVEHADNVVDMDESDQDADNHEEDDGEDGEDNDEMDEDNEDIDDDDDDDDEGEDDGGDGGLDAEIEPPAADIAVNDDASNVVASESSNLLSQQCPPDIPIEIWSALPDEVRLEILAAQQSEPSSSMVDDLMANTEMDREFLESLPPEIRNEILQDERRRRSSAGGDHSAPTAASSAPSSGGAVVAGVSDLTPAQVENRRFMAEITDDSIRQEALLSAAPEFLATLTEADQEEARRLRSRGSSMGLHRPSSSMAGFHSMINSYAMPMRRMSSSEERHMHSSSSFPDFLGADSQSASPPSTKISLKDDIVSSLPFQRPLTVRLCLHLISSVKLPKSQKAFLRLLTLFCRYRKSRRGFLYALLDIALQRTSAVQHLECIPLASEHELAFTPLVLLERDSAKITETIGGQLSTITLRRVLHAIAYVIRKAEMVCWYEVMSKPPPNSQRPWIFEELLSVLRFAVSAIDLDGVLHLLECICRPLEKLSVPQANQLVASASAKRVVLPFSNAIDVVSHPDSVSDSTPHRSKRRTRSHSASKKAGSSSQSHSTPVASSSSAVQTAVDDEPTVDVIVNSEGAPVYLLFDHIHSKTRKYYCCRMVGKCNYINSSCDKCEGKCGPGGCQCKSCAEIEASMEVDIPFPEITVVMAERLASVAGSDLCGGTMRKQIQRVLATLSLYDENWKILLTELSSVASRLSDLSAQELVGTHAMLKSVADAKGSVNYGDALYFLLKKN